MDRADPWFSPALGLFKKKSEYGYPLTVESEAVLMDQISAIMVSNLQRMEAT